MAHAFRLFAFQVFIQLVEYPLFAILKIEERSVIHEHGKCHARVCRAVSEQPNTMSYLLSLCSKMFDMCSSSL